MRRITRLIIACAVLAIGHTASAVPVELINNGGFETGDFSGWSVINSGSGNWAINDGSFDPAGPGGALAPISGNFDAVSFQGGPGQHILAQSIISVPHFVKSAVLSWSDRIRNHASQFSDPNQEWRMLILDMSGNLIQEIFSTDPGDPLQQVGPNNRSFDISALLQGLGGQQIQLSWEQQDNLFFFNATLDNASLIVDVPEPGTLALLGIGLFGLGLARRRKTV